MIYVCLVTRNHASTIGLVLWKIRQVFDGMGREYQILVADDASNDGTFQTLTTYQKALPMTVLGEEQRRGYAASVEALLRTALERTDRPRRDLAITLPPDFSASPIVLPEIVKRFESGADLIVGEARYGEGSFGMRLVRRSAPWLLRPGLSIPGVSDLTSGVSGMRLVTLKHCFPADARLLATEGRCANAELVARVAQHARQIAVVQVPPRSRAIGDAPRENVFALAVSLFRAGRSLSIPAPSTDIQRS